MHIRIVTFELAGITAEDYRREAAAVAGGFTGWPGLLGKVWLAEPGRNRFGGVYLFASAAAADRSRSTPLFAGLAAHPGITDLRVEEFGTLAEPTALTWPGVAGPVQAAVGSACG